MDSGCALGAGLVSGHYSVLKGESLSKESVWNVVPLMHDLLTAEGCSIKGVQNIGHGSGRRLNDRDGGPVPGPTPWAAH